ncbi:CehA/McbA family metallohydrolase [Aurantimonas sp. HBX-1]|uniref:CehA/McbA family metallohydrolase n=1 Tax=Aurantimonas sp. HBX-1 TaxID=2906072 RepID=UPI001F16C4F5|nr:CehA/McbA family metallohydrolase [Aurantimonas sp. HBX-1]UIJ72509.1 CehA/McbA family metallohydrolase [Aurantimonas sp. HBX-1]
MTGLTAFTGTGRFFRGNIHTHSDRSDGALPPQAVCRHYEEAGYDFLCLSDHFLERFGFPVTDTTGFRSNRLTTIFGAEIHAPENSHGEIWHLLACGLPLDFAPLGEGEDAVALARRAVAAGAFLGIAHPQWSSLSIEDGRQMAGIAHAVEIWNTGCDVECARGDGTTLLDALLSEGHRLTGYAADDAHFKLADYNGGWMMVRAEANEPEALLAAMKAGAYYSTQGPTILDVAVEADQLEVAMSPAVTVSLVGRGSRAECVTGRQLTRASLPLTRFVGDWCRLVVTDAAGKRAWSNPIWP